MTREARGANASESAGRGSLILWRPVSPSAVTRTLRAEGFPRIANEFMATSPGVRTERCDDTMSRVLVQVVSGAEVERVLNGAGYLTAPDRPWLYVRRRTSATRAELAMLDRIAAGRITSYHGFRDGGELLDDGDQNLVAALIRGGAARFAKRVINPAKVVGVIPEPAEDPCVSCRTRPAATENTVLTWRWPGYCTPCANRSVREIRAWRKRYRR